ncbi:unnamed protein product [Adineta ricciae]|uniref:Uncharacterized protein n=2 Tax=Adineta ricciae TaxID=249248 RepID=A0A816AMM3_ADIRI|nr:unnamed protein product [Adineta ricciae]
MSSTNHGSTGMPSIDDISQAHTSHVYTEPNASYIAATSSAAASMNAHQVYYNNSLPPPQQHLHVQSSAFYPSGTLSHVQHQHDVSNSSSSVASSSSSLESPHRTGNRKRSSNKPTGSTKTSMKRKAPNDNDDDDDEENQYYLRNASTSTVLMSNHTFDNDGTNDEDRGKQARENHCEIERRRRVKMATYFTELCDMVPTCSNLARKPDKLTILRMAAQFMKTLRANNHLLSSNAITTAQQQDSHKPSFLNDQELKYIMVESCDAFLFALDCDNLHVIYVSDAIQHILSYACQDWYSKYFFDFIHPDDVEKVREQFNLQPQDGSSNDGNSGRVLDIKTGTIKKDGHGSNTRLGSSKRSFICRIRVNPTNSTGHTYRNSSVNPFTLRCRHRMSLGPSIDGHLYEVVHVSGYIRNLSTHHPSSSTNNNQVAFVGIARVQNSLAANVNDLTAHPLTTMNSVTTEFTCRCHPDTGEVLFIDQRCTSIIGYESQELLHKSIYELIHPNDQMNFQELFKRTVTPSKDLTDAPQHMTDIMILFRTHLENKYIALKASMYAFSNPCSDQIEFVILTFQSNQTITRTSVIANTTDYHHSSYGIYSRPDTNPTIQYPSQSLTTFNKSEEQEYPTVNEINNEPTYASNTGGTTWTPGNDSWITTPDGTTSHVSNNQNQANLPLYHQ